MPLPPSFPDLVALELFLSVVREGSVSRAAAAHGIAQPSATNRIKTLERQLGMRLLDRTTAGSTPTAEGSVVAGWAERVVRAAEELSAGVNALKAAATGEVRIAASYTVAEYLLPTWLDRHRRERPEDRIELEVVNSASVLDRLRSGVADLGFIESPIEIDDLAHRALAVDRLVTVVAPGHPWAERTWVPVEALVTTPLVLREIGSGTRESLDASLASLGYDAPIAHLELGSTSAVKAAIATGRSPGVLSDLAVADDIGAGRLAVVNVRGLAIERTLRVVWSSARPLPPSAADLVERIAGA